jgi:hypothetical protein
MFNGGGAQQAAQQQQAMLQAQADKRNRAIKQDTASIDSAFDPFNDKYFGGYTKSYEHALNPQLDWQYGRPRDQNSANPLAAIRTWAAPERVRRQTYSRRTKAPAAISPTAPQTQRTSCARP